MTTLILSPDIAIDDSEILFSYIRSSGPGGQNVNKVSTAVQLRFNIKDTQFLTEEQKQRIYDKEKSRISGDGWLVIAAHNNRSQEKNKEEALDRLRGIIEASLAEPKNRIIEEHHHRKSSGSSGGESNRRAVGNKIRFYDPEEWGEEE